MSAAGDMLFALPVHVKVCPRNRKRLIVVFATGEVLLRTLSRSLREQDVAERFARAMNEWSANHSAGPEVLAPFRFGLARLEDGDGKK